MPSKRLAVRFSQLPIPSREKTAGDHTLEAMNINYTDMNRKRENGTQHGINTCRMDIPQAFPV